MTILMKFWNRFKMGSYQLIENELHYTGNGWTSVTLNPQQIKLFKKKELDLLSLDWK